MDWSSFLGGGGGGKSTSSSATAQTIFGGYNAGQNLDKLLPWLIGGAVVAVLVVAAVLISALRR